MSNRRINLKKQQGGFSLLEVMIAMLLLAFGALGQAVLQLKTLQSSHSAYQRGIANIIAADTVERLWANSAAAAPQTVAQIQQQVQQKWSNTENNNVTLPGLTTTIIAPAAGNNLFTVRVTWTESRFGNNNTTFTYSFRMYQ